MKIDLMPQCCQPIIEHTMRGLDNHIGTDKKVCAVMLMDKYRGGYVDKIGQRRQMLQKSIKAGHVFSQFNYSNFVPDVVEINRSKAVRAGGPMKPHYMEGVEQKGGYPTKYREMPHFTCNLHQNGLFFGIFRSDLGRKQGEIMVNVQLIAYSTVHIVGNLAIYSMIIGHGDYLSDGIMTHMTVGVVEYLLKFPHVKYFMYSAWSDGGQGLQDWKRWHKFEPLKLER